MFSRTCLPLAEGHEDWFQYIFMGALQEVAVLVNEKKEPGTYTVDFSASNLASGMYLYRLQAGEFVQTKKMVLLK